MWCSFKPPVVHTGEIQHDVCSELLSEDGIPHIHKVLSLTEAMDRKRNVQTESKLSLP